MKEQIILLDMGKAEKRQVINNEFENKIKSDTGHIFSNSYGRELGDRANVDV